MNDKYFPHSGWSDHFDLNGRIVLGEDTLLLRNTIRDLIANRQRTILLNMGKVPYIDSSGIGELVAAFTTVRKQGAH